MSTSLLLASYLTVCCVYPSHNSCVQSVLSNPPVCIQGSRLQRDWAVQWLLEDGDHVSYLISGTPVYCAVSTSLSGTCGVSTSHSVTTGCVNIS